MSFSGENVTAPANFIARFTMVLQYSYASGSSPFCRLMSVRLRTEKASPERSMPISALRSIFGSQRFWDISLFRKASDMTGRALSYCFCLDSLSCFASVSASRLSCRAPRSSFVHGLQQVIPPYHGRPCVIKIVVAAYDDYPYIRQCAGSSLISSSRSTWHHASVMSMSVYAAGIVQEPRYFDAPLASIHRIIEQDDGFYGCPDPFSSSAIISFSICSTLQIIGNSRERDSTVVPAPHPEPKAVLFTEKSFIGH